MSNAFTGIITPAFKLLHKQMIDAVLEDEALTVPCTLHYATKYIECPNCYLDALTGKSSSRYKTGGPIEFTNGRTCPYCGGEGKKQEPQTEVLYLATIWDSKQWILPNPATKTGNILVQTMSKITTYDKLIRTTKITLDNKIKGHGITDFVRIGDPLPQGLGDDNFILCSWGRT